MADPTPRVPDPPDAQPADPAWQVLSRRLLADRSPFVVIYDEDIRLPDGRVLKDFVRVDVIPFAIMFAVLEDGRVPLVRQWRMPVNGYSLELPAGHIEADEDPIECAKRELYEEAGVEAADWQFLGKYIMDANRGCGVAWCYLATGGRVVAPPDPNDLGTMSLHLTSLDEVRRLWANGEFRFTPVALTVALALHALENRTENPRHPDTQGTQPT